MQPDRFVAQNGMLLMSGTATSPKKAASTNARFYLRANFFRDGL